MVVERRADDRLVFEVFGRVPVAIVIMLLFRSNGGRPAITASEDFTNAAVRSVTALMTALWVKFVSWRHMKHSATYAFG